MYSKEEDESGLLRMQSNRMHFWSKYKLLSLSTNLVCILFSKFNVYTINYQVRYVVVSCACSTVFTLFYLFQTNLKPVSAKRWHVKRLLDCLKKEKSVAIERQNRCPSYIQRRHLNRC